MHQESRFEATREGLVRLDRVEIYQVVGSGERGNYCGIFFIQ